MTLTSLTRSTHTVDHASTATRVASGSHRQSFLLGRGLRVRYILNEIPCCKSSYSVTFLLSELKLIHNMWSQRRLKFTYSHVRYFISLGLWHWKTLFRAGLMNLRIFSLKESKLVEFRITAPSLFQSIIVDGKKVFLKKLCSIFIEWMSLVFLVL